MILELTKEELVILSRVIVRLDAQDTTKGLEQIKAVFDAYYAAADNGSITKEYSQKEYDGLYKKIEDAMRFEKSREELL
ncbi:hypothetical protein HMPREF1222_01939 [Treponema vincentii F0403]|uniref:Uncharacterized protein n=1 Tax=Treponema vincentii F0403 TaxID=1125702 RepID=S3LQ15_9SPIR|nr:hypothetical protein [Treponema vincentii]EPF46417.1 hypothetical protein HMPREF1222_01939 [Treponema vincentii F0403]